MRILCNISSDFATFLDCILREMFPKRRKNKQTSFWWTFQLNVLLCRVFSLRQRQFLGLTSVKCCLCENNTLSNSTWYLSHAPRAVNVWNCSVIMHIYRAVNKMTQYVIFNTCSCHIFQSDDKVKDSTSEGCWSSKKETELCLAALIRSHRFGIFFLVFHDRGAQNIYILLLH